MNLYFCMRAGNSKELQVLQVPAEGFSFNGQLRVFEELNEEAA